MEETDIIEGEVVEIQTDQPAAGEAAAEKTGRVTLCTTEMETVYDLGADSASFLTVSELQLWDEGVVMITRVHGDRFAIVYVPHRSKRRPTSPPTTSWRRWRRRTPGWRRPRDE